MMRIYRIRMGMYLRTIISTNNNYGIYKTIRLLYSVNINELVDRYSYDMRDYVKNRIIILANSMIEAYVILAIAIILKGNPGA